jgi:hypothetical protein
MVSKAIDKLEEYLRDILPEEEPIPGATPYLDEIKEEYNKEIEEFNQKKDIFDKELVRIENNYRLILENQSKQHKEEKEQIEFSYKKTIENLNKLIPKPNSPDVDNEILEQIKKEKNILKEEIEIFKNNLREEIDKEKQELNIKKDMFDKELIRIQKDNENALDNLNKKLQKEKEELDFNYRKKLNKVEDEYTILERQFNQIVILLNENGIEWGTNEP